MHWFKAPVFQDTDETGAVVSRCPGTGDPVQPASIPGMYVAAYRLDTEPPHCMVGLPRPRPAPEDWTPATRDAACACFEAVEGREPLPAEVP